jgi:hypothetical protein
MDNPIFIVINNNITTINLTKNPLYGLFELLENRWDVLCNSDIIPSLKEHQPDGYYKYENNILIYVAGANDIELIKNQESNENFMILVSEYKKYYNK